MLRTLLIAAVLATTAGRLEAQIAPSITGAVNAARNSAAAANAHTDQVNAAGASASVTPAVTQAAKPAQPAPASKAAPKGAAPKAGDRPGDTRATTPVPTTRADSASASKRGAKGELAFSREVFAFEGGSRDPFFSLLRSSDLRPLLSDLKLVTIIYDATGRNSVAILRDVTTKDQYRVKVGQTLGRMRVAAIQPKQVNFIVEEFGYSRQESLALSDTTKARLK